MAYLVSALLPPQAVLMSGVFVALIFGAFLQVGGYGGRHAMGICESHLAHLSRHVSEAFLVV